MCLSARTAAPLTEGSMPACPEPRTQEQAVVLAVYLDLICDVGGYHAPYCPLTPLDRKVTWFCAVLEVARAQQ
jgi:hypothetical protein